MLYNPGWSTRSTGSMDGGMEVFWNTKIELLFGDSIGWTRTVACIFYLFLFILLIA